MIQELAKSSDFASRHRQRRAYMTTARERSQEWRCDWSHWRC